MKKILLLTLFVALGITGAYSQAVSKGEVYKIKLALIEKIIPEVYWPKVSDTYNVEKPFIFGVFGDVHPFGEGLLKLTQSGTFKSKKIVVHFYETPDALKDETPDLLFFPEEQTSMIQQAQFYLIKKPTLIIADIKEGTLKGAMFSLYLDETRIRFEISNDNLTDNEFVVNPALIKLSEKTLADK